MQVIPLGTNGFFSSFIRQTACYAIPYGKILILLDAGSGLFRLSEKEGQRLLKGIDQVHIFLSHYHLDHTFGFYSAFNLLNNYKVKVFGPKKREVFKELPQLRYFPINYEQKYHNFSWIKLNAGSNKICDYSVSVCSQNHRRETSLAYLFNIKGKTVAYVTDGEPYKGTLEIIKNTDLLLHEHWFSGEETLKNKVDPAQIKNLNIKYYCIDGHVTTVGAARIAKMVHVKKLVLIHHNPFADEKQLEKQLDLAKSIFPNTILAKDLQAITF